MDLISHWKNIDEEIFNCIQVALYHYPTVTITSIAEKFNIKKTSLYKWIERGKFKGDFEAAKNKTGGRKNRYLLLPLESRVDIFKMIEDKVPYNTIVTKHQITYPTLNNWKNRNEFMKDKELQNYLSELEIENEE